MPPAPFSKEQEARLREIVRGELRGPLMDGDDRTVAHYPLAAGRPVKRKTFAVIGGDGPELEVTGRRREHGS